MTFDAEREELDRGRTQRFRITTGARPMPVGAVIHAWQRDASFRTFFVSLLSDAPFAAFRWETPPVTSGTLGRAFEFVLLDSPGLDETPDPSAFADHLEGARDDEGVVVFDNLGHDAVLVAPTPRGPRRAYGHLAAFVRHAPAWQVDALWRAVGRALESRIDHRATWTSTAGGGVPWLHVRLDSRPKYYRFDRYRSLD